MNQKITLNGKQYPFAITHGTMESLDIEYGISDIAEVFTSSEKGKYSQILAILFEGVKSGCRIEKVKCELTMDSLRDMPVRQVDMTSINKAIINCMIPEESPNAKAPKVKN